ncbi:MAG: DUF4058 family protein, partial [Fimbriimonadales bacterium]|nr:DUF4058 family protein [Fimbriimonadales bacterium]
MAQHRIVGMDPYIEAQAWGDFHMNFIVEVRDALVPVLVPKYIARIEVRTYIDEDCEAPPVRYPDVMPIGASSAACNDATEHPQCALTPSPSPARGRGEQGVRANVASEIPMGITKESAQIGAPYKQGGIAVAAKPILRTVPLLVEHRERFIEIYTRADRQLVTVIELLSPSNKRP